MMRINIQEASSYSGYVRRLKYLMHEALKMLTRNNRTCRKKKNR